MRYLSTIGTLILVAGFLMQKGPQDQPQPGPMKPAPMQPAPMQPAPMQPAPMQPAPMQPAPVKQEDSKFRTMDRNSLPRNQTPRNDPPPNNPPTRPGHHFHWHPNHGWIYLPAGTYNQLVLPLNYQLPAQVTYYADNDVCRCPHCGRAIELVPR